MNVRATVLGNFWSRLYGVICSHIGGTLSFLVFVFVWKDAKNIKHHAIWGVHLRKENKKSTKAYDKLKIIRGQVTVLAFDGSIGWNGLFRQNWRRGIVVFHRERASFLHLSSRIIPFPCHVQTWRMIMYIHFDFVTACNNEESQEKSTKANTLPSETMEGPTHNMIADVIQDAIEDTKVDFEDPESQSEDLSEWTFMVCINGDRIWNMLGLTISMKWRWQVPVKMYK